jgi:hypothetical protein
MGRGNKAAKTRAIAFGFQVVLGTLVNAILNDPGPLIHSRPGNERAAQQLPAAVAAGGDDGADSSPFARAPPAATPAIRPENANHQIHEPTLVTKHQP